MSRRMSPLAGFQVTTYGRFWVTAEVDEAYRLYARNINLQLCLDALAADLHSIMRNR